jgi:hypothetical protein
MRDRFERIKEDARVCMQEFAIAAHHTSGEMNENA